jgi:hypothetical protein
MIRDRFLVKDDDLHIHLAHLGVILNDNPAERNEEGLDNVSASKGKDKAGESDHDRKRGYSLFTDY